MFGYTVSEIAAVTGGTLVGDGSAEVTLIVRDNRDAVPGSLFAALRGENRDGHAFLSAALDAGAACALANFVPEGETRPVIVVEDVQAALERLAADFRRKLSIPVIGITGSVGKTTAKEMVFSVLSQRWRVMKTPGNYNNQLGVPLTLSRITPENEMAVVELGVSHFGDMLPLAKMAKPDAMLFTIIGRAHLEFFGDREGVFREKTSVLKEMDESAVAFVNGDDDLLRHLDCRQRKISFGLSEGCDVRAEDVRYLGNGGTSCVISFDDRRIPVTLPYGEHLIYAALEGAAVGSYYGLTDEEILRGIESYSPTGARARVEYNQKTCFTIINDCYNANPDSVEAGLRTLMRTDSSRRVAILGDMGELGEDSEKLHFEIGRTAAACGVDLLITCGTLAKAIAAGAREAGLRDVLSFETMGDTLAALPEAVWPGDRILVKASHSMRFEKIVAVLREL